MRVLQVESNKELARVMAAALTARGLWVETVLDELEAVEMAGLYDYDLIILDWALTGLSGLRRLRSAKISAPIMVVSSDKRSDTLIAALNAGADDYAVRPVEPEELAARARAVVRRRHGHAESVVEFGNLSVDLVQRIVSVAGVPVLITGREYSIVELMALRRGAVATKGDLMNHIYGVYGDDDIESGTKILDVWICRIRAKLRKAGLKGAVIETVWGRGFVLRALFGAGA
jgi:two-component system cell cycle response regulator CtrA